MSPSAFPAPTPKPNPQKRQRALSARRLILLGTTIAGLGVAALVVAPGLNSRAATRLRSRKI
ncbi:MAG: hypothetical protein WDN48_04245 [Pseudolabrys sp.]